ncbi:MAG TPA: hypothetical protein VG452_04285 [Egibacteraceae bacterium]|nr:hypothetical protein [Egibacteraceae bacterium]
MRAAGRPPVRHPCQVGRQFHVGDVERHRLERPIALPNAALAGVARALVDTALDEPGGQRGKGDAALVEDLLEVRQAAAAFAQLIGQRHAAAVEGQVAGVGGVPADLEAAPPTR